MSRKLADETYGIAHEERQIVDCYLTYSGVEGCKQLVFGKYTALAQQVHQSRFAHVGVTDKSHSHQFSAILALG